MSDLTTIGGLRDALAEINPNLPVYVGNRPPTALSSYRGFYDHLAIECSDAVHGATDIDDREAHAEVHIRSDATVRDLSEALYLATFETFVGYKGGHYEMYPNTDIWVSEHGQADGIRVVAIDVLSDRVELVIDEEDDLVIDEEEEW